MREHWDRATYYQVRMVHEGDTLLEILEGLPNIEIVILTPQALQVERLWPWPGKETTIATGGWQLQKTTPGIVSKCRQGSMGTAFIELGSYATGASRLDPSASLALQSLGEPTIV